MKLKSLSRSANCCWSPEEVQSGIFLAAGTTAQQVDASFSVSSQLEILSLDVASTDSDLKAVASTVCDQRFHKLVWTSLGIPESPYGTVVGGTDDGTVQVFDVQRMMNNERSMVASYKSHSGPIHALDVNPFQCGLLASGSRESEVHIWDLSSAEPKPLDPGAASQPLEDVVCLAWNRQVQHILASAMASRCVVWDLRKSEPIIRVSDSSSRFRCKAVAWNPQVPTQMCLASEDDHCPWLQIWDLRYASSPVKTLEKHSKGVLSISWHPKDQDMLVSCGKGGSVCIWNPNGAQGSELISELSCTTQWNVEVDWCPRNPAIVSVSSLSGEVGIYSVIGGEQSGAGDSLRKAPSWLSGGVGAQFGFGGKLITFSKEQGTKVDVNQVVTDDSFIERVRKMESALFKEQDTGFWAEKLAGPQAKLWSFLQALQDSDPNSRLKSLLGFKNEEPLQESDDLSSAFENSLSMNGVCKDSQTPLKIVRSLVVGDVSKSVDLCLKSRRFAEALFLADYSSDPALKQSIRKEYLNANRSDTMCRLVACVSSDLWEELAHLAPTDEWETTVAAAMSHLTDRQRASNICSSIATRLRTETKHQDALLCSVVARDLLQISESYIAIHGQPVERDNLQAYMEVMSAARVLTRAQQLPKEISKYVGDYVKLLAEQGCLDTSLYYLNDLNNEDASMNHLRDRILQSQGLTTSKTVERTVPENQFSRRTSRPRTVSGTSLFEPVLKQSFAAPQPQPIVEPPKADLTSRPLSRAGKYPAVVDPSIRSNAYGYPGYNESYGYGNSPTPVPQYSNPPMMMSPVAPVYQAQPTLDQGYGRPPSVMSQGMGPYGGYQPPQQQPAPPPTNLPAGNEYTNDARYSAPGWNDPPPITSRRKSNAQMNPTPIPAAMVPSFQEVAPPQEQIFQPQPMQHFVPNQTYQAPVRGEPKPVIEKGPIPAEVEYLHSTFERLREACLVLQDGLVRRKLDDVHAKLDQLADRLRQHSLSDITIQNLQLIVNAVQQRDYNQALQMFSHVAKTCNMSETSAFLPGIKTLISVAHQHQIYA